MASNRYIPMIEGSVPAMSTDKTVFTSPQSISNDYDPLVESLQRWLLADYQVRYDDATLATLRESVSSYSSDDLIRVMQSSFDPMDFEELQDALIQAGVFKVADNRRNLHETIESTDTQSDSAADLLIEAVTYLPDYAHDLRARIEEYLRKIEE